MKDNNILIAAIFVLICLVITACKKTDSDLINGPWKVESIIPSGSKTSQVATDTYILDFLNKREFSLELNVNSCEGKYGVFKNGKITIDYPGCTKICCDTDYAEEIRELLSMITDYSVSGETLRLTGDGEILLSRL